MKRVRAPSYHVNVWIAGVAAEAVKHMEQHVQDFPYCVTITPTTYVHTSGTDAGVIVGLINYPRFPTANLDAIWAKAEQVAAYLCEKLGQQSYTIEAPDRTEWFSHRPEDAETPPDLSSRDTNNVG